MSLTGTINEGTDAIEIANATFDAETGAITMEFDGGGFHYTIEGQVAVDRLGRYEDLEAELESFGERVGLPGPLAVPRTKDSQRSDRRHYREVLRDEDAEKIAKLFADEIALLGYEY